MRIIKKKGFSMIELLATIVILGIISTIAIVSYTKYIERAKQQKDKQNEATIIAAAKAYLNANVDEKPKTIGESKKITLHTLRENHYLKEDIKNSKDESCMENSYVYVYKNGYTSYSYKGILYCGNDQVKPEEELPKPVVKDFNFSDINDVNNASFSMTLHGNSDDTIGIESYNYSISVINKADSSKTEMYNSGAIDGRDQKIINLKNIMVRDYIDVTDFNTIRVSIVVRNNLGAMTEYSKETNYADSKGPRCSFVEGEANEGEWLNKADLARDIKRQITVTCNDEQGSGCLRKKFSKTWPNTEQKSIEYSVITITDNSKNKNKTNCRVRVNVDGEAPTAVVSLIGKATPLIKIASDGTEATIEKTEYPSLHNGWINSNEYPDGLQFQVNASDDVYLYRYTWETSGSEVQDVYFEQEEHLKNTQFIIELKDDGNREGVLTIYDRAGNTTKVNIKADIDRTPPTNPTVTGYKKPNGNDVSSSTGLSSYTFDTWYNGHVFVEASGSSDITSGFEGYYCTTHGQAIDITDSRQSGRNVSAQGVVTVSFKSCDQANNCSEYVTGTVKLDRTGPSITCNLDSSGKIKNIKITKNFSKFKFKNCNSLSSGKSDCITDTSYETMVTSSATSASGIQANWGDTSMPTTCGKTLYGYVRAKSESGKENIAKCSGSYSTGTCCTTSNPFGCKKVHACRDGNTYIGTESWTGATCYFDSSYSSRCGRAWAGHVKHSDTLYYIKEDKTHNERTLVCAETGTFYTGNFPYYYESSPTDYFDRNTVVNPKNKSQSCVLVWIFNNCIDENKNACPSNQCPG